MVDEEALVSTIAILLTSGVQYVTENSKEQFIIGNFLIANFSRIIVNSWQ